MTHKPGCIYCGAPFSGDNLRGSRVPLCRSMQKMDATRTETCRYIEEVRRCAEDLDTAVMGIDNGILLGGTHLSPPREFGRQARARYEALGPFELDDPLPRGRD